VATPFYGMAKSRPFLKSSPISSEISLVVVFTAWRDLAQTGLCTSPDLELEAIREISPVGGSVSLSSSSLREWQTRYSVMFSGI
jgi:hypothetical protein